MHGRTKRMNGVASRFQEYHWVMIIPMNIPISSDHCSSDQLSCPWILPELTRLHQHNKRVDQMRDNDAILESISSIIYGHNSRLRVANVTIFLVGLRLSTRHDSLKQTPRVMANGLHQTAQSDFDSSTQSDPIPIIQSRLHVVWFWPRPAASWNRLSWYCFPSQSQTRNRQADSASFLTCKDGWFWHEYHFNEPDSRLRQKIRKCWHFQNKCVLEWSILWKAHKNGWRKTEFPKVKCTKCLHFEMALNCLSRKCCFAVRKYQYMSR